MLQYKELFFIYNADIKNSRLQRIGKEWYHGENHIKRNQIFK